MVDDLKTEGEAWNIAGGYVHGLIFIPFIEISRYLKIAEFGSVNLEEDLFLDQQTRSHARLNAIRRIISLLDELIDNTYFHMKKKQKETLDKFQKKLTDVKKTLGALSAEQIDQRTNLRTVKINEPHFFLTLDILKNINRQLKEPLNERNLIFIQTEEFDIEALKKGIVESG